MKKLLVLLPFFSSLILFSQDYGQFNQQIDVTAYRGGEFKLTAFVRIERANPRFTQARLWARVDKTKGIGFFDNMYKRPILSKEWKEYSIEGPIDEKAMKLIIGGLYFGIGTYFYDNFILSVRKKDGEWKTIEIANPGFEESSLNGWFLEKAKDYTLNITTSDVEEGKQALVVDGTSKIKNGKFQNANGIDFYYETYGKGDTVLLLHGNSESLKSFKKQIPDFSKQFFVIAMDSRAQGYSSDDGKKITYDLMAEDVNSFLDQLHIKNLNVLGWSDGGNTGIILAMKHPDKVKRLATMGANLLNDKTSVDEKINKEIKKLREQALKDSTAASELQVRMSDLLLNEPKIDPKDLKSITCPVLVMAGSKDVIKEGHTKLIASSITKSKLVIFEKSTHYAPQEIPDKFNKTVIEFFTGK
jgi:pimeloyl-ACP methyl ester carboxylesterase